ncbi:hypothetical protein CBOM_07600 [Ceraceosorus bombacis]|uniref:Uncharacterized protein n=1 Tax=Ceraceosorus bombacis TaxID=401625 RepID=A0A0N7L9X6_9BASI|nr:hypothetical protein CBOM_07600 [Ceraceosorus bombacis]
MLREGVRSLGLRSGQSQASANRKETSEAWAEPAPRQHSILSSIGGGACELESTDQYVTLAELLWGSSTHQIAHHTALRATNIRTGGDLSFEAMLVFTSRREKDVGAMAQISASVSDPFPSECASPCYTTCRCN